MSYAEVAAMKPRVGGEYAFLHDAYGPLTAFLYTWTWTTLAKPASIATIAAGLMRVLGTFPAFAFLDRHALGPHPVVPDRSHRRHLAHHRAQHRQHTRVRPAPGPSLPGSKSS